MVSDIEVNNKEGNLIVNKKRIRFNIVVMKIYLSILVYNKSFSLL